MDIFEKISEGLQRGKSDDVAALVQKALKDGIPAVSILNDALLAGMDVVGVRFKNNEIYIPQVMLAARAMNAGMDTLKPMLAAGKAEAKGRAVLGTVKGDMHDIGKNLVRIMFEGRGIEVTDLGVGVAPEAFIDAAVRENAQIIACSALLTTTMRAMRDVVELAREKSVRERFFIMVGGAPVTEEFGRGIGADGYAPDAASASELALQACMKRGKGA